MCFLFLFTQAFLYMYAHRREQQQVRLANKSVGSVASNLSNANSSSELTEVSPHAIVSLPLEACASCEPNKNKMENSNSTCKSAAPPKRKVFLFPLPEIQLPRAQKLRRIPTLSWIDLAWLDVL